MNVITRGFRNAFRNAMRTSAIVVILGLSIGLALAMLIARQAVGEKISSVKSSVGNTVSISPAGVRGFDGGGDALTSTQLAAVKKLTHVTSVSESLNDRLTSKNSNLQSAIDAGSLGKRFAQNSGQSTDNGPVIVMHGPDGAGAEGNATFTPPVMVRGTTTPADLGSSQGGGTFTLTAGKAFEGTSSDNVALVGKALAEKNNLKVGSTFTAYDKSITVAGIFDAGNSFSNNQVIMPLKTLQTLSGQTDAITSAVATVDSIANVDGVTSAVQSTLNGKADVTNSAAEAKSSLQPLENIQTISLYSLIGAVVAGAVIILMTMIMIVRERRREIGVIKAIGAPNSTIVGQFTVEAMTLTVMGAVLGTVLGALASNPITRLLVNNSNTDTAGGMALRGEGPRMVRRSFGGALHNNFSNIHTAVGWDILLYGLGAALLIAVIGSGIASYFIAKVRPAEVMRAE